MNNSITAVGVEIKNLTKTFPVFGKKKEEMTAVNNVSLSIAPGELVTLLGPSGCGKTSLLRMVAGFLIPTSGSIVIGGEEVSQVPPNKRNVGMMFQSYALFPHMTVFDNVAYGLKLKHESKDVIVKKVNDILELMQISEYKNRFPNEISGGQQQRVALARAVVTEPSVLLFDEPLSNLDAKLREYMRGELRKIQKRVGITSIYVTHDQSEAMAISDKVVIMRSGNIEQIGTSREIYARPKDKFVAGFIGKTNYAKPDSFAVNADRANVTLFGQNYTIAAADGCKDASECTVMVRPEDIKIVPEGAIAAKIVAKAYFGQYVQYILDVCGQEIEQMDFSQSNAGLEEGDEVRVDLVEASMRLLPGDSTKEA